MTSSSFASNPFYFNESEAETSTTSATFVNKTSLTFSSDTAPYLIIASGEIRGGVSSADVRARLFMDSTDYGNISFQPDTTGDKETFMFMRVVNLSSGSHTAIIQFAAESGQTTYIRRTRIFATKLDSYFYAENESAVTPSTTGTDVTTLTFTPVEAGNYLILGTAEISAGATTQSIGVNLSIDNSVVNTVSNEGETTTDFESFAGQNTTYLTAASHTIKIVARSTSGTTQKIRRARIVAIRIPENYRNFFNESSAQSSTQVKTSWVEKVSLIFTPPVTGTYFITGSADIWSSTATNGAYVDVNLTIDGTEYGFTSIGLSDVSDRLTFVTSKPINLTNASHNVTIYFRQTESVIGTPTVFIRNARINALGPDDRPSVKTPLTYNSTLAQKSNFSIAELVRIRVNVSDAAGSSDISQVLINITKPNGTINVTNALMTSIASITNGFTYEYNFTIPDESASSGTWNTSIIANDTINAKGSNRTNFSVADTTLPNLTFVSPTPANNTIINQNYTEINISISEQNLDTFIFNWNGTNTTYNSTQLNGSAPNYWFFINKTDLADGQYTYYGWANDTAGNSAYTTNYTSTSPRYVTVDTTPPSIIIVSPVATTYNYSNILVNISATDNVAVDSIWFNWNGTNESYTTPVYVNFTPDGTYTLYAYANDTSNNANSTNVTFTVNTTVGDTTPPVISNVNATSITNQSATITWDTDELSNSTVNYGTTTALGSYATNSSLVTSHSIPLTGLTNFTLYYYNVTSCDASGNCNTTGPFNFTTLQNNDATPPSITFVAPTPANSTTINVSYAFINTTVTDNVNVSIALLEWNGTNESMLNISDNWYKNKTSLTDGSYTYKVWANDTSNNWNVSETRTLTVSVVNDTTPPTINYTISPKVAINGTNVSLTINASDSNLNTTWAVIKLPDSSEETINLTNSVAYYYTTAQIGRHNITFYANDSAGNTANATDHFIVGEQFFFNTTIVDGSLNGINSTIKFYYLGNEIVAYNFPLGNFTNIEIANYVYDILISAYSDALQLLLNGVNISQNSDKTIGMDRTTISGFVITYGINNSYNITNATAALGYNGTNYTNEALLNVYRCNNWNFTARACEGTWNLISAAQNTTGKYFTLNTTNLSGFSIKQEAPAPSPPAAGARGAPLPRTAIISVAENKTEQYIIRTCLQKNQKVEFYLQGNKKVTATEVRYMDVWSTLLINNSYVDYYNIKLYDTVMFDTNNNGLYDLKVNLYALTDSAACYIFYEIRETIPKINITKNITEAKKEEENVTEQPIPVKTLGGIWILPLILIIIMGTILFLFKRQRISIPLKNGNVVILNKKNKTLAYLRKRINKNINKLKNVFSSHTISPGLSMEMGRFVFAKRLTPKEVEEKVIEKRVWRYHEFLKQKEKARRTKEVAKEKQKRKSKDKKSLIKKRILGQLKEVYKL